MWDVGRDGIIGNLASMHGKPLRASAALSAVALTLLTLFVFWVLQDYGPESAIRRFHDAVLNGDTHVLAQVTQEDIRDPRVAHLAQAVTWLDQQGARSVILGMHREPKLVAAEVQYTLPDGGEGRTWWIVVKIQRTWKVDASQTGQYFRSKLRL